MKARADYNDFQGTVAADIDDTLGRANGDNLQSIGKYFKINEDRFKIVGLSIYGTRSLYISLICVDKDKSTVEKEHIVSMSYDVEDYTPILDHLFKRLHIVIHDKYDTKYKDLEYQEEVNYTDFHEADED